MNRTHAAFLLLAICHTGGVGLIDPILGTTTPVVGLPTPGGAGRAVFANGGRDLCVAIGGGSTLVDVANGTSLPLVSLQLILYGNIAPAAWR